MAEVYEYERLEPIPASYGWAGIVLSIAFFQTLNQTVLRAGCPKAVGRENYWKWRNLVVSWTHAIIVGVWDITWYVPGARIQGTSEMRMLEPKVRVMILVCG